MLGPSNGQTPGQQFVDHHAKAEDVGARIDRLAARLLRRHVGGGTHHDAGVGLQVGLRRRLTVHPCRRGLREHVDPRLHQRGDGGKPLEVGIGRLCRQHAVPLQVGHQAGGEVLGRQATDVLGVDRLGLLLVPPGRVGVDVVDVERRHELVRGEQVVVVGDGPAQGGQVVDHALADEATVAVQEQVGLRVTLGQLLVALAEHERHVPEDRDARGGADRDQGTVERDLARGGREQVLAADHVGDPHRRVVDRVDQRVEGLPRGPDDHEVRHRAGPEGHVAADQVGEGDVLIGHPHPQHRLAALGPERGLLLRRQVAVVVVVAQLGVAPGRAMPGLDLLVAGEGLVGEAGRQQVLGHLQVQRPALALAVRLVRTTDARALVVVQAQPAEGVDDLVEALLAVPVGVRVLDPEDERATGMARVGPVEQGGPGQPDVRGAGGRGAEADPDRAAGGFGVLVSVSGAAWGAVVGAVVMMGPAYRRPRARTEASVPAEEGVGQGADALDLDLDPLAADDRADAGGGPGEDDVAGQQREGLGGV